MSGLKCGWYGSLGWRVGWLVGLALTLACTGSVWAANSPLKARADSATVKAGKRIRIDVLANDRGVKRRKARVKIIQRPKRGVAFVTSDKKVLYEAPRGFRGKESFVYRVWDGRGHKSTATVSVKVRCGRCGKNARKPRAVRLSWWPSRGAVEYYEVLFGTKPSNTEVPVATARHENGGGRQVVSLRLGREVPAEPGDRVCFRVRAVSPAGQSKASEAKCTVIR